MRMLLTADGVKYFLKRVLKWVYTAKFFSVQKVVTKHIPTAKCKIDHQK